MSSQARTERGGANRPDLRTLVIASVASAVAAIVVSRIWASGTPIAAAATPVLVTLLREVLDRPTSRIAERFTADTRAVPDTEVREPVAARARREPGARQADPSRRMPLPPEPHGTERPPGSERPTTPDAEGTGDIRVYRQQPSGRVTGKINPKVALITGLLAFVIAGLLITGGQVLAGHPFGSEGNGAIILGQHKTKDKPGSTKDEQQQTTPDQRQQQTTPKDQQQKTTPQDQQQTTTPDEKRPPAQTTPGSSPRNETPPTPAPPSASP
ncbi:MAG: hypothetical protein ACR2J6_00745 [Thermoleophilaceae bacterium]